MSEFDRPLRIVDPQADAPRRPAWMAIAAAALLHALVAAWIFADWDLAPAPAPPPIVATLVFEPPPAPPPPAAKPPPPTPPQLTPRQSGPDETTTAPPPAEETAPEPSTPPPPPAASTPVETAERTEPPEENPAPAPQEKPAPPSPPRPDTRKSQLALRAPTLAPRLDRALGERPETGDPYLNALWLRIERHRDPTTPLGPAGLHLEGVTTYEVLIARGGQLASLYLIQSSGSPLLDDEARRMIVAATPFPPLPPDYPDRTAVKVTIHLYPQ